jgi:outer membrane protein OmpA-like peptidoglycan-associated protein
MRIGLSVVLVLASSVAVAGRAELRGDAIVVAGTIEYEAGSERIRDASRPLLDAVAGVLADHPKLALVEIQVHTDPRGSEEWNRKLSQARADAVVAYLVAHGVARNRLRAHGYGEEPPLARTLFVIVEKRA